MPSDLQQILLKSLTGLLRPLISLCLKCGIGFSEFQSITRKVFVAVASEEYGLRGRPTNVSRVAAMTGISRKEIRRLRDQIADHRWTPAMESSPANVVLHYWYFDEDFCGPLGVPLVLPVEGKLSFSELVRRYAGDIPIGAMKEELKRAGVVCETEGQLAVRKRYFQPEEFDQDFIRNIFFSLRNITETVVHNAGLVARSDYTQEMNVREGRFERLAWSERLGEASREAFRQWVRREGAEFIEKADDWIGRNEHSQETGCVSGGKSVGVGLYFFEED